MSTPSSTLMTAADFEAYAAAPENAHRHLELIAGRVVEMVSNSQSSRIAAQLLIYMGIFVLQHDLGYLTGADGGYQVGQNRVIPDAAFISKRRMPQPPDTTWIAIAPDLAIEVISPTDKAVDIADKVNDYVAAGAVVWLVDPETQTVHIYAPGQPVQRRNRQQTLSGGTVLPGFEVAVSRLFD